MGCLPSLTSDFNCLAQVYRKLSQGKSPKVVENFICDAYAKCMLIDANIPMLL
jgi:hypothetical protein